MASSNPTPVMPHPRVGVAAIITNSEGKVVCGKRLGSHGAGTWQLPGGHLEFSEEIFAGAEREAEEETGLKVRGRKVAAVTNDIFSEEGKHYITVFVMCAMEDSEAQPVAMEPHKCPQWFWKSWDELRTIEEAGETGSGGKETLFLPLTNLLKIQGFRGTESLDSWPEGGG